MVYVGRGPFSPRAQAFLDTVGNVSIAKPFTIQTLHAIVNDHVK